MPEEEFRDRVSRWLGRVEYDLQTAEAMLQTRRYIYAVLNDIRAVLAELASVHNIKAAYVFGSYAKSTAGRHSDIDVAVVLGEVRDGSPFDERFEIFHKVQQHNSLYEVVCFREEEFREESEQLVRYIKREGIRIL